MTTQRTEKNTALINKVKNMALTLFSACILCTGGTEAIAQTSILNCSIFETINNEDLPGDKKDDPTYDQNKSYSQKKQFKLNTSNLPSNGLLLPLSHLPKLDANIKGSYLQTSNDRGKTFEMSDDYQITLEILSAPNPLPNQPDTKESNSAQNNLKSVVWVSASGVKAVSLNYNSGDPLKKDTVAINLTCYLSK